MGTVSFPFCYTYGMSPPIRPLTTKEIALFHRLFADVLSHDFPGYTPAIVDFFLHHVYTPPNIAYFMNAGATIIGAWEKGDLIGFAFIDKPYGGVSMCRWLGVEQGKRHQGTGRSIVAAWKGMAADARCHKLELAGQPDARGFYEKAGFKQEGTRLSSYFGIDQHLFGMILGTPDTGSMTIKK